MFKNQKTALADGSIKKAFITEGSLVGSLIHPRLIHDKLILTQKYLNVKLSMAESGGNDPHPAEPNDSCIRRSPDLRDSLSNHTNIIHKILSLSIGIKLNQKGIIQIPPVAIVLILLIGLAAGLILVRQTQIFKPRAEVEPGTFNLFTCNSHTAGDSNCTIYLSPGEQEVVNISAVVNVSDQQLDNLQLYVVKVDNNNPIGQWSQVTNDFECNGSSVCQFNTTDTYTESDIGRWMYVLDVNYRRFSPDDTDPNSTNYSVELWCSGTPGHENSCGDTANAVVTARGTGPTPPSGVSPTSPPSGGFNLDAVVSTSCDIQGRKTVTFSWASISNAISFALFRKASTETNFTQVGVYNGQYNTSVNFTNTNVLAGNYQYRMEAKSAINGSGTIIETSETIDVSIICTGGPTTAPLPTAGQGSCIIRGESAITLPGSGLYTNSLGCTGQNTCTWGVAGNPQIFESGSSFRLTPILPGNYTIYSLVSVNLQNTIRCEKQVDVYPGGGGTLPTPVPVIPTSVPTTSPILPTQPPTPTTLQTLTYDCSNNQCVQVAGGRFGEPTCGNTCSSIPPTVPPTVTPSRTPTPSQPVGATATTAPATCANVVTPNKVKIVNVVNQVACTTAALNAANAEIVDVTNGVAIRDNWPLSPGIGSKTVCAQFYNINGSTICPLGSVFSNNILLESSAIASATPGPSSTPGPSVTTGPGTPTVTRVPSATTTPVRSTSEYRVAETREGLASATPRPYTLTPQPASITFASSNPGTKQVCVQFKGSDGVWGDPVCREIDLIGSPTISGCNVSPVSGTGNVDIEITGTNFGSAEGAIIVSSNSSVTFSSWTDTKIIARYINPPATDIPLSITTANGLVARGACSISQLAVGAQLFCPQIRDITIPNTEVTIVEARAGAPVTTEKVTLKILKANQVGVLEGLTTKLQEGRVYKLAIKVPRGLRKTLKNNLGGFTAQRGTTNVDFTREGNGAKLPLGDISPVGTGDGQINSADFNQLKKDINAGQATSNSYSDLNQDTWVNSLEWACMRPDFGGGDDPLPAAVPVLTPTSIPTPSPTPISMMKIDRVTKYDLS